MTTVDFGANQVRSVGVQRVCLRKKWQDSWTLYYDVQCTEATWCLSPTMPTATLVSDYGWICGLAGGVQVYNRVAKLDVIGWYVKVTMETNTLAGDVNTWYGVVAGAEDEHRGVVTYNGMPLATGCQTIHCYGLEHLLDKEYLAESYVDVGEAAPKVFQVPITFNKDGKPNRNNRLQPPHDAYCFEGQAYRLTGTDLLKPQWWSTRDIVKYLVEWMVPKDSFRTRNQRVPFFLWNAWYLNGKDHPVLEQEGQTVLSLLNRLIDRRRLRSFFLSVKVSDVPGIIDFILVNVVPWNKDDIDTNIIGSEIVEGNPDRISLLYDYNQSTSAQLRKTQVNRYDRIIVRGARRTSTATFHVAADYLEAAWTAAEETAYEAAASGEAGYAGWDDLQKQQRNAEVRNAEELSAVYAWFKLPDDWGFQVASPSATNVYPVFVDEAGLLAKQYIHDVVFESSLPLYEHVDYSGAIIADGTAADPPIDIYRQPLVVFKIPTDARYVAGDAVSTLMESTGDAVADGKNFRWSAACRMQPETRTFEVRVSGEKQHVIAETDFTPLADDRDLGDFDYKNKEMLCTLTLRDNRYAEGKYPIDGAGDGTDIDQQFGFVIYAGDALRRDYVVPATVVDVDTAGALVVSNGGYVRDDTDLLNILARVAYEWWAQERTILTLSTSQLTSAIQVGKFIETIGDSTVVATMPDGSEVQNQHYETVNTVVSELRITWPRLEGNQRGMPTMQFTTGAGELDPMTLMPPRAKTITRAQARITR
jgi:hypothetical protein